MTDTSPSSALPAIVQPMAEVYPPDDVCVLKEGDGSYVCRVRIQFVGQFYIKSYTNTHIYLLKLILLMR